MVLLDSDGSLAKVISKWFNPKGCPVIETKNDEQLHTTDLAGIFIFVACGAILAVNVRFWHDILFALHLKSQTRKEKRPAEGKESVDGMVSVLQADRFKRANFLEDLHKRLGGLTDAIAEQKEFERTSEMEVELVCI